MANIGENSKKKDLIKDDVHFLRKSISSNPNRDDVINSLNKVYLTDKEKIESGEYSWVTVIPEFGKAYKALRKKQKQ